MFIFGKERRNFLKKTIDSLTVNDFNFESTQIIQAVRCDKFRACKKMNFDGTYSYFVYLPQQDRKLSMQKENVECDLVCSVKEWLAFQDITYNCTYVDIELFLLTVSLSSSEKVQLFRKCRFSFNSSRDFSYTFKRYNIPKLITDTKPFSADDYENAVIEFKKQMSATI